MKHEAELIDIMRRNRQAVQLLEAIEKLSIPDAYLAAGFVSQSVWNERYDQPYGYGIDDADVVYFDSDDLSKEAEAACESSLRAMLPEDTVRIDAKNEARVHLWYAQKFGKTIPPYPSAKAAIDSFPTTATAVGIRLVQGHMEVYAPFGLEDLFAGIVRPNKTMVTETVYYAKSNKWKEKWPNLICFPW